MTGWQIKAANVSDTEFLLLVEQLTPKTIVLADKGLRRRKNQPLSLKISARGVSGTTRLLIKTGFSLLSQVCKLKYLRQRV